MTADAQCVLCELPIGAEESRGSDASGGSGVRDDEGNRFCCRGCREVHDALGDVESVDAEDVRERAESDAESSEPDVPEDHESTFLEVEGMHCVTCEAFIESAATEREGVSAARASYVTETVRVDHDPAVDDEAVADAVSGLGYSAFPRGDAFQRRRADNWAFARMGIGLLVGMMIMLPYLVIIYPTYFDGLFYDPATAEFLEEMMAGSGSTYFFVVIGVLTSVVLFVTGKPILQSAFVSIRTRSPNMNLLIALAAGAAYAYSWVAIVAVDGVPHLYFDVTVAIVVVVTVANHYESQVKREATELLSDLTTVQVDSTRLVMAEGHREVSVDDLSAGDRVLVRSGERVPVDGEVVDGEGAADEAVVTGESLPVHKAEGDRVVGGSVVTEGAVVVAVAEGATSSVDRIATLVWDLQSGSRGIQGLADRLATIFVPVVLTTAVLVTAAYLLLGAAPTTALLVGLTVLIVACPCAMGLAAPLSVASGVREALERGIVVFDETVFERIRGADTVVFDKTGTLTTGELEVVEADASDDLLGLAAELEGRSAHPAATAIATAFGTRADGGVADSVGDGDGEASNELGADSPPGAPDRVESFEDHTRGVSGVVGDTEVVVGHPDLFADLGWIVPEEIADRAARARNAGHLPVVVGRDGAAEGVVVLADELREGWAETVAALHGRGTDVVVLTGDDERAAERFRRDDRIDRVFAGVPPEGKAETVGRLAAEGETVMVGDGTNDAPALARADLGIALGGGTAMAVDAADVAVVDDDLRSIGTVFDLAAAAGRRVKENVAWAFAYNAIAIPLAIVGLINPLFAALAMVTSSALVVTNSARDLL